uniref:solute carrier family 23 member 1-like n=1 Tax=Styela clava TaxID=7725 RepID=UPI001939C724|nr:solute carrier family 23 member 1-like [Styela clava]
MDDKSVELKVGNGKIDDDTVESNIDISTNDGISTEDKKNDTLNTNLLYRVDESPPWYIAMVFGFQQLMICLSIVTFPLIIMSILCADDSPSVSDYKTAQIGTVLFIAGTSTFVQTTFGVRLPIIQGTTVSFMVSAISVIGTDRLKCPAPMDLNPNSTYEDYSVSVDVNSSKIIYDNLLNKTINVDVDSNYYRDNDGIIRNSNELWLKRLYEIQGGVICASFLQIALGITGAMGFLLRFIGPLTIAPTLALISYGIFDTVSKLASDQWGIALLIVALFFICAICLADVKVPIPYCSRKGRKFKISVTRSPIFSMFPILFAILTGWLICYLITIGGGFSDDPNDPSYKARTDTNSDATSKSPWFRFPYPFQFGMPIFTASTILGMMAAVLPGILESIGDYNATSVVCEEPSPPKHAVNRGILMEGIGILCSGLWGTGNATSSWSSNLVVLGISRVASRRTFQFTGLFMVILGLFTKFCSIFSSIPKVVIGGSMCATIGMILAVGVATLKHVDMSKNRNLFIFGFSILFGIVLPMFATKHGDRIDVGIDELTNIIGVLIRSPMFIGGITGFILDNIAPGTRKERGLETFYAKYSASSGGSLAAYQLPFSTDWNWTKWIPICPKFDTAKRRFSTSA